MVCFERVPLCPRWTTHGDRVCVSLFSKTQLFWEHGCVIYSYPNYSAIKFFLNFDGLNETEKKVFRPLVYHEWERRVWILKELSVRSGLCVLAGTPYCAVTSDFTIHVATLYLEVRCKGLSKLGTSTCCCANIWSTNTPLKNKTLGKVGGGTEE